MEKAVLEREKESVEKEFNQNRDILEKLSNDVSALTARQEQLKGQHQFIVRLLSAFEKEEQKTVGKVLEAVKKKDE